ncbi:uncharacterized protein FPRO_11535 [Fusarium proliferatum ET1]|uniref:Uncharacterized protein n=1 Tax=Fusarium proliferatum (strain ET1) TaxID=1227346 RepID=A0A1L7W0A7_FUSPR|nr:uncharacterized protein FPRO_11535 [Fusarium proliferatum ET1]CZR46088.1 uncharacterized protein FPRO_11535 [Fusarium proliferatum ET1]
MPDYDNQFSSWLSTMETHKSDLDIQENSARNLGDRMRAQTNRYISAATKIFNERDVLMDTAYKVLIDFVGELLKYANADDEIGSGGVPSLPIVVGCFKALAEYCEKVIDDENIEAAESMQETGETSEVIANIRALKDRILCDFGGLDRTVSWAEGNFNNLHEIHMRARDALNNARDKQSGFFYDLFGDSDIDNAVSINSRNEEDRRHEADAAWNFWDRLRNLRSEFQSLPNSDTDSLINTLESLSKDMKANYEKIGLTRKTDNDCWVASRSLQYHVTTQTEYTSRDDALRHVIKLLHTVNKTIDDDVHVQGFKDTIEANLRARLGEEKAKELHQEKKFLPLPDDLDM